jgi:hypothetical protein
MHGYIHVKLHEPRFIPGKNVKVFRTEIATKIVEFDFY